MCFAMAAWLFGVQDAYWQQHIAPPFLHPIFRVHWSQDLTMAGKFANVIVP